VDNKDLIEMQTVRNASLCHESDRNIWRWQLFGWGTEDVEVQISSMASSGQEATYCMGDDAPLAALSAMPHTLYDYFKQRFAQVKIMSLLGYKITDVHLVSCLTPSTVWISLSYHSILS
jgi:hypothetical protein